MSIGMDPSIYCSEGPFRAEDPIVARNVSSPVAVLEFTSTNGMDVQMTDVTLNRTAATTYEGMKPADPGYSPGRRDLRAFAQTSLNVCPGHAPTTCTSPTAYAISRSASPLRFQVSLSSRESAHGFRMRDGILTVRPPPVCTLPRFRGELTRSGGLPSQGRQSERVVYRAML